MQITFLGQGFESVSKNSVGNSIIQLFKEKKFTSFTGISAFASEAGVLGLSECIASSSDYYETLNLIVGIDQEGTSMQTLQEINNLGINSYIFYQKESPIFHPKLYLFEGENDTTLIIGSSNLTARGLFGNIESSLMVEFKNDNLDGIKLLKDLRKYYKTLFDFTDQNLFKISPEIISQFVSDGIVPTRKVWREKHKKNTSNKESQESDLVIPKRPTVKIPSNFKGRYKSNQTVSKLISELEIDHNFEFENVEVNEVLWQSGPLKERDLSIPKSKRTSNTASMLFKKASMDINPRYYFRDEVFQSLNWIFDKNPNKAHYERAVANFKIVVSGIDYGTYALSISHNTNSEQLEKVKQPATQLHWGEAKKLIAQDELIGKNATLYKNISKEDAFTLIIE